MSERFKRLMVVTSDAWDTVAPWLFLVGMVALFVFAGFSFGKACSAYDAAKACRARCGDMQFRVREHVCECAPEPTWVPAAVTEVDDG